MSEPEEDLLAEDADNIEDAKQGKSDISLDDESKELFGSDLEDTDDEKVTGGKSSVREDNGADGNEGNESDMGEDEDDDEGSDIENENEDEDGEEESDGEKGSEGDEREALNSFISKKSKLSRKRKLKGKDKPKKKSKKRAQGYRYFSDFAEEGDEEEEDTEEREAGEELLDRDNQAAVDAVEKRHAKQREFLSKSAEDIAKEYEERHRAEEQMKESYESFEYRAGGSSFGAIPIAQQALLPKVTDPKIFKLKCKTGMEQMAVRAIMMKTIDMYRREGFTKVKSVFCGDVKGYIYVEAVSEAFAKEVVNGLKMVYISSFAQVPIPDMPAVLNISVKKKPLEAGQWVRIKRGPLKGDLARIYKVLEGGDKVIYQAIPRPDYTNAAEDGKRAAALRATNKVRPPQRLFDAEQAKIASNGNVFRRIDKNFDNFHYDIWEKEHYRDGFLYKEVKCDLYIQETNVNPKIEELNMFLNANKKAAEISKIFDSEFDDDQSRVEESGAMGDKSFTQQLAQQIASLETEDENSVITFVVGDHVMVIGGELVNLVARIVALDDMRKTAKIVALKANVPGEFDIEWNLLVKHVVVGAHVKVMKGKYAGQTGRVVSVMDVEGTQTAAVLTDGLNNEIQCNVSFLQMSSEVATGYGNLMGYELYDLVNLNENESAVVINVMVEKLRVLNHLEQVKDVSPQQITSKQNVFSAKAKSFDAQQHVIAPGDTVNVIVGTHLKLTGTIKHIVKGKLWLHSDSYLKNSGIFVVPARNCVVAGGMGSTVNTMANVQRGLAVNMKKLYDSNNSNPYQSTPGSGTSRIGREPLLNKMITITKGAYKGLAGLILDSTSTHYSVELLAKLKKVTVPKTDVKVPEMKAPAMDSRNMNEVVPSTPFLTSHTPMHMLGSETPSFTGGETPSWGNMTPYGADPDNPWKISAADTSPNFEDFPSRTTTPRLSEGGGESVYGDTQPHMMETPVGKKSEKSQAPVEEDSFAYMQGMVVVLKRGEFTGRMAVVVDENDGLCEVRLRDGQGRLSNEIIRVSSAHLGLADAQKDAHVVVLAGKFEMKTGVVTKSVGKDLLILLDGENKLELLKKPKVAWIHAI